VNGVEIEYNSYSVNFNSIDGPEVVIRFFADDVNIEHLHSVFTQDLGGSCESGIQVPATVIRQAAAEGFQRASCDTEEA
jgi:hypothetical protein